MKTIVISDIHVGDPRNQHEQNIINMLKTQTFDRLVINGDLVDLWLSTPKELKKNPLIMELVEIAHCRPVIWVLGNHDHSARGKNILPGAKIVDSFKIFDKHSVLFIHGHQAYFMKNASWYHGLITRFNIWMWKTFGIDLQSSNKNRLYSWYVAHKRAKLLRMYGQEACSIVIGHTHRIGHASDGFTDLYDMGSTEVTRTYGVVQNGAITMHRL